MILLLKLNTCSISPSESWQETFLPRNVLSDPTTASQVKPGLKLSLKAVEETFQNDPYVRLVCVFWFAQTHWEYLNTYSGNDYFRGFVDTYHDKLLISITYLYQDAKQDL